MSNVNWAGLGWLCVFLWAGICMCACLFMAFGSRKQHQALDNIQVAAKPYQQYTRLNSINRCMDNLERCRRERIPGNITQSEELEWLYELHYQLYPRVDISQESMNSCI